VSVPVLSTGGVVRGRMVERFLELRDRCGTVSKLLCDLIGEVS
jgi:hypothetical protein